MFLVKKLTTHKSFNNRTKANSHSIVVKILTVFFSGSRGSHFCRAGAGGKFFLAQPAGTILRTPLVQRDNWA